MTHKDLGRMSRVARRGLHQLTDAEIDAIYALLETLLDRSHDFVAVAEE